MQLVEYCLSAGIGIPPVGAYDDAWSFACCGPSPPESFPLLVTWSLSLLSEDQLQLKRLQ